MNKQDLKSLLENIYHLLAEEGDDRPPLISPPTHPGLYIPGYGFVPLPPTDDEPIDQDEGDFRLEFTKEQWLELLQRWSETIDPPQGDGGTLA